MRWYGHMRRMTPSRAAQRWWKWKPKTTRPCRGRPRKRWTENIKEAVESRGSTLKEIEQSALFQDREEWRNFVTDRPYAYQISGSTGKSTLNGQCALWCRKDALEFTAQI